MERIERSLALLAAVVLVLLSEWQLLQQEFLSGVLLYSIFLVSLLLYAAYRWGHKQRALVVLAIPAVIRILNFTLPLGSLDPAFAQMIVAIPLALSGSVFTWLFNLPRLPLDFQWKRVPLYVVCIVLGAVVGFVLFQIKRPPPVYWSSPLLIFFYLIVIVGAMAFLEEWLFRGIMQTGLSLLMGQTISVALVALIYAVLQINQGAWTFVLFIFVFALGLGWLRTKSTSLTEVFLVHAAANIVFYLFLPWR